MRNAQFSPAAFVLSVIIGVMLLNVIAGAQRHPAARSAAEMTRAIDEQLAREAAIANRTPAGPIVHRD